MIFTKKNASEHIYINVESFIRGTDMTQKQDNSESYKNIGFFYIEKIASLTLLCRCNVW